MRSAAEAWEQIGCLIADTLERSSSIERSEVRAALDPLDQLARMLISAGHLEKNQLVLVAGELWLEISTISGGPALTLEENLNPVPGAGSATTWMLHIPQVEPMAKLVRATVKGRPHLSADEPVEQVNEAAKDAPGIDFDALARWAGEDA